MKFEEVDGDLIVLAKQRVFDVVAHGCNCFCAMGAGLAPQMAQAFGADKFPKESIAYKGDINKLGTIDYATTYIRGEKSAIVLDSIYSYLVKKDNLRLEEDGWHKLQVVNCYTQYGFGRNHADGSMIPLSYLALELCFRKMNHIFKGKHIGLPEIGCHLGGGDWSIVKQLIRTIFVDVDVTVVHYKAS